jgi:hypothetical protein
MRESKRLFDERIFMRARCSWALALAVAGLLTMSCGGIIDPSTNAVETFSGTVPKGGVSSPGFAFTVGKTGEFTVKLTALAPASSVIMGVLYNQTVSGGACSPTSPALQQNNFVLLNAPALTGQIFPGGYCVFVFDPSSSLTATETFTATVSHP